MFPIPPHETLIETKVCKHCGISFPITDKDMEFYEKVSPKFPPPSGEGLGVRTYLIPPPTLCPDCRQQRRLSFRNERKLYKRTCDATGKEIVSIYSPDKPFKVYHQDYWWSDKWNPMDYGKEFDFSRSAMEQFGELLKEVPKMSLLNSYHINSEYCCHTTSMKNSYCVFWSAESEDCIYSNRIEKSKDIIDSSLVRNSSLIYGCFDIDNSYKLFFSQKCLDCMNCYYLFNCSNCKNCFGCVNLQNKEYYIFNEPYEKSDYITKIHTLITNYTEYEFKKMVKEKSIFEFATIKNSENIQGDSVYNSHSIIYGFWIYNSEHLKYCQDLYNHSQDSYDCYSWYGPLEKCYECYSFWVNAHHGLFIADCYPIMETSYSDNCYSSSHLFLCVWLRNKQYCILNKQYTKEEYESLVPRIIEHMMKTGEWGEFFPSSLSPFGYNETVAQEHFPMSREEVLNGHPELVSGSASVLGQKEDTEISSAWREVSLRGVEWNETTKQSSVPMVSASRTSGTSGSPHFVRDDKPKEDSDTFLHWPIFNWSDYEPPFPKVDKIIPARKLPEDISSIPDDILNWAIECEVTEKPFRIIPQELEFYRKHHLPIPRRHPDQRHLDRMQMRNPRKLYERVCDCPDCERNHLISSPFPPGERNQESGRERIEFTLNPRTGKKGKKIITTYAPERPEQVYCEVCYEREVVG